MSQDILQDQDTTIEKKQKDNFQKALSKRQELFLSEDDVSDKIKRLRETFNRISICENEFLEKMNSSDKKSETTQFILNYFLLVITKVNEAAISKAEAVTEEPIFVNSEPEVVISESKSVYLDTNPPATQSDIQKIYEMLEKINQKEDTNHQLLDKMTNVTNLVQESNYDIKHIKTLTKETSEEISRSYSSRIEKPENPNLEYYIFDKISETFENHCRTIVSQTESTITDTVVNSGFNDSLEYLREVLKKKDISQQQMYQDLKDDIDAYRCEITRKDEEFDKIRNVLLENNKILQEKILTLQTNLKSQENQVEEYKEDLKKNLDWFKNEIDIREKKITELERHHNECNETMKINDDSWSQVIHDYRQRNLELTEKISQKENEIQNLNQIEKTDSVAKIDDNMDDIQEKSNEILVKNSEKISELLEKMEDYKNNLDIKDVNNAKRNDEIGITFKELTTKIDLIENTKNEIKESKRHESSNNNNDLLEKIEVMFKENTLKDEQISSLLVQICQKDDFIMKKDTEFDQEKSILMTQIDESMIVKSSQKSPGFEDKMYKDINAIKITLMRQIKCSENLNNELMIVKQLNVRRKMIKLVYDYGAVHSDVVSCFAFSPDEKYAFSVGFDRKLLHYNIQKIHKSFDTGPIHNEKINFFGISRDGNDGFTVSRDRRMKQFNIPLQCADKNIRVKHDWGAIHQNFINDACISTCSRYIYTVSSDLSIKEWNIVGNCINYEWAKIDKAPIVKVCYCNNINSNYLFIINELGCIKQFDIATKALLLTLDSLGEKDPKAFLATPNGKLIIIGYANGNVISWNVDKKCIDLKWGNLNSRGITSMALTPCGSFFFTGGADGTQKMWNLLEKRCQKDYEKVHTSAISALGVSPNGSFQMTGGHDKRVKQFEIIEKAA